MQAGGSHFAIDVNPACTVSLDAQGNLRVLDKPGQAAGQFFTGCTFRQAGNFEGAQKRELDQAFRADVEAVADRRKARGVCRQRGACRGQHQFRVIPDDDVDHVARANPIWLGLGLRKQTFYAGTQFSFSQGALLGDEFGRDGEQDTGRRRLVFADSTRPGSAGVQIGLLAGLLQTPANR